MSNKKKLLKENDVVGIASTQNHFIRAILLNLARGGRSRKNREEALRYFEERCAYCGTDKGIELDHAIPANREKLGTNQHGNLVPACKGCNSKKRDKDYIEYCRTDKRIKNAEEKIRKIKKFMEENGYKPLTQTKSREKKIRMVLNMAWEEIRVIAKRYIELVNLLK